MEGKVKDILAHYLHVQYDWLGNHHKLTYYKDFITPQNNDFIVCYYLHKTYHGQASVEKVSTTEEHNRQNSGNEVKSKTDVSFQKVPNGLQQLKAKNENYKNVRYHRV